VNWKAQVLSDGSLQRRKRANLDAVLSNWIHFKGLDVKPATMTDGAPRVNGALNSQYRADGELETKDRMQFTIAARVADVLPNNKVLSENIAELSICKQEEGSIPDSYQRGWLGRLYDHFAPF